MSRDPRIAIAQNLARIYQDVLHEPIPPKLLELVMRLEAREKARGGE